MLNYRLCISVSFELLVVKVGAFVYQSVLLHNWNEVSQNLIFDKKPC